jgi:hypothetical protein
VENLWNKALGGGRSWFQLGGSTHSKDTHSKEWKPFSTALRLGLKVLPIEKRRNVL